MNKIDKIGDKFLGEKEVNAMESVGFKAKEKEKKKYIKVRRRRR